MLSNQPEEESDQILKQRNLNRLNVVRIRRTDNFMMVLQLYFNEVFEGLKQIMGKTVSDSQELYRQSGLLQDRMLLVLDLVLQFKIEIKKMQQHEISRETESRLETKLMQILQNLDDFRQNPVAINFSISEQSLRKGEGTKSYKSIQEKSSYYEELNLHERVRLVLIRILLDSENSTLRDLYIIPYKNLLKFVADFELRRQIVASIHIQLGDLLVMHSGYVAIKLSKALTHYVEAKGILEAIPGVKRLMLQLLVRMLPCEAVQQNSNFQNFRTYILSEMQKMYDPDHPEMMRLFEEIAKAELLRGQYSNACHYYYKLVGIHSSRSQLQSSRQKVEQFENLIAALYKSLLVSLSLNPNPDLQRQQLQIRNQYMTFSIFQALELNIELGRVRREQIKKCLKDEYSIKRRIIVNEQLFVELSSEQVRQYEVLETTVQLIEDDKQFYLELQQSTFYGSLSTEQQNTFRDLNFRNQ